jgi:two-component system phosphate regulon sensor histidine kinase PhoR
LWLSCADRQRCDPAGDQVYCEPLVSAVEALRGAVEALARDDGAAAPASRHIAPMVGELWLAILRLTRVLRDQVRSAEGRLAAAEAVIAAVPDPLILLDDRRRVVRANAQAASFVGIIEGPRDLAAVLRNPAVLGAADAVLRGEAARVVDFTVTVPIERQLRARLARLDPPSLDGAVVVLSLHDITQLKRAEQMRADFIANASHELRTPLTTLTGFIETLRGPAREDAEARERFLAIMHEQAARMIRLVEDLLSLSRIELNELTAGRRGAWAVVAAPRRHPNCAPRARHAHPAGCRPSPDVMGDRDEPRPVVPEPPRQRDQIRPRQQRDLGGAATGTGLSTARRCACRAPAVPCVIRARASPSEHLPRLTERFYRVDTARLREMATGPLDRQAHPQPPPRFSRHREHLGAGSVFTVLCARTAAAPGPEGAGDGARRAAEERSA